MNEIITQNRPPASGVLSIDLETFSSVDLPKCGVYRYVESPDFEILLFAYAFDDEEVQIIDMAGGEAIPKEVLDALEDGSIIKAAWNAQFERTCLSKYLGHQLSPDSWRCSMVHAASLSLPLSLKEAAKVLKTGEQKDRAGENLIRYFSIPCKPTKSNGGRTRNLPEHDPEGWQQFKDYCLQDVRTERDIRKRLENFPLPDAEWDYYHMDQRINDRGVGIDTQLVTQAIACDLMLSDAMQKKAYELTGLENPNSVSQLKTWLEEKGIPMDSLGKKDVAAMIKELDRNGLDEEAMDMLKLRLQMAKSSVKKYQAAERCVCEDGRARGLFQFYGANRTGRFCLTGDHEVLTDNGWKRLDEWAGGRIACWNAASEAVSFQNAEQVSFDYEGPMYTYRDVRIDQCSTPDHKMRAKKRYDADWQDMTVEQMAGCRPTIPIMGYRYRRESANPAWLRVLIMTQADGYYTADGSVRYHFKKSRKVERCKSLLRKAEIPFVVNHYQNEVTAIDIPARAVPLWLREFRTKTFGFWLLDENPEVFFDELPYWDGSRPAANSIQYTTTNKTNADIVQALAHMSGRCASMKIKHRPDHPNWNDAYVMNIWLTPGNNHEIRVKPEIMDFNGKVYCAVTKTGYFLVRRNGRVWVTGNSGRNIQLQNLPQNHIDTLDEARNLVKMGCFEAVEMLYGNTPDVLSQLIRTMLIPKEGCEFIVTDFSAIEARVLAWEAGEQWRLDAFRSGADIYCESASHMFGVPVVKHGVNSDLRQRGKVAELACIAKGSLVLTDKGLVPIEEITLEHRLWDGESWVSHEGLVYKGRREVITYEGLTATPDHMVFYNRGCPPMKLKTVKKKGYHLWMESAITPNRAARKAGYTDVYDIVNAGPNHRFTVSGKVVHNCGYGGSSGALISMGALDMGLKESELPDLIQDWRTANPKIVQYWWDMEKAAVDTIKTHEPHRIGKIEFQYYSGTLWMVLPSGRKLAYLKPKLQPNRFGRMSVTFEGQGGTGSRWIRQETYSGKLVENCIAEGTEVLTMRGRVAIENIRDDDLVWDGMEWVPHGGLISKGMQDTVVVSTDGRDGIHMTPEHRILLEEGWCECGRSAGSHWAEVRMPDCSRTRAEKPISVHLSGQREQVYDIRNCGPRHRFCVYDRSAGEYRIVSNCTQAIARDILVEAMYRMEKAGLEIIGHVHDEAIIEVPRGKYTVEEICRLMAVNPDWCRDLPLNADGYRGDYYFKS